jgi:DNA repair exonuclease SbcCD ATPase subunit
MTNEELVKLLATTNEQLQQALKEQSSVSDRLAEANEKMKEKFLVVMAERDEAWRRAGHAEEQWGRCEVKLATCEKYRDAYAACDRIGTEAYRELESKLEKAVVALDRISKGDYRVNNVPDYVKDPQPTAKEIARTALAEIEGEKT